MKNILLLVAVWISHSAFSQTLPDQAADKTMGVVNCASSLCHGSAVPWTGSPVAQNEYIIWSRVDKHAKAYAVLLNEQSQSIARKLGLPKPAHRSKECLDCHAHNPAPVLTDARHKLTDGVSCEACHGPSGRWLPGHTAPGANHSDNIRDGLYPLDQPQARAALCMSCHFGNTAKYVNHRTMAAGHPRLGFELNTFTSLQPAHFTVDADYIRRKGNPGDAKVWALGQAYAVRTQMDILLDPVRGRDGAFPELTLFDCHACHRPMADQRWQPRMAFGGGLVPGLVRINDANMLMVRLILQQIDTPMLAQFAEATAQLNLALAGQGNVTQSADKLRTSAIAVSDRIAATAWTAATLRAMALALIDDGARNLYPDYVAAEQAVMALGSLVSAMHQSGQLRDAAAVNRGLAALRKSLEKDEAYQSSVFAARLRDLRPQLAVR